MGSVAQTSRGFEFSLRKVGTLLALKEEFRFISDKATYHNFNITVGVHSDLSLAYPNICINGELKPLGYICSNKSDITNNIINKRNGVYNNAGTLFCICIADIVLSISNGYITGIVGKHTTCDLYMPKDIEYDIVVGKKYKTPVLTTYKISNRIGYETIKLNNYAVIENIILTNIVSKLSDPSRSGFLATRCGLM